MSLLLCLAYHHKFGIYPDIDSVSSLYIKIFGDDNIVGLTEDFSQMLDEGWLRSILMKFCLRLKFLNVAYKTDKDPLHGITFLGASFGFRRGIWIPVFPTARLAYSVCYDIRKLDIEAYISKLFSLFIMSYGDLDFFHHMRGVFQSFCEQPKVLDSTSTIVRAYRQYVLINEDDVHKFYAGYEGSTIDPAHFNFSWALHGSE